VPDHAGQGGDESNASGNDAYNARWGYDGTASQSLVDEALTTGDWSQPKGWSRVFTEWQVGSQSQGFRNFKKATHFLAAEIVASCAPSPRKLGDPEVICTNPSTCATVPGVGWDTMSTDQWYVAFNQARTNSKSKCRFTYGYDNDVAWNDTQQGVLCTYWDGKQNGHLRMTVGAGYRLMAR
jgi:hypothetical protein